MIFLIVLLAALRSFAGDPGQENKQMELNELWLARSGDQYLSELQNQVLPEEEGNLFRLAVELTPAEPLKRLFLDALKAHERDGGFPDKGDLEMRFDVSIFTTAVEATLGSKHHQYLLKKRAERISNERKEKAAHVR